MTKAMLVSSFIFMAFAVPVHGASLNDRLLSADDRTRQDASEEVSTLSEAEKQKLVISLIHTLKGSDIDLRERAILIIGKLGTDATPALPALKQALGDDYPVIRQRAIDSLKMIGPSAVPVLIAAMKSDTPEIRVNASQALAEMASEDSNQASVVPALVQAVQNPDSAVRDQSLLGLERVGKSALAQVTPLLHSKNDAAQLAVVQLLGKVSTSDASVSEQLVELWGSGDSRLRLPVARALTKQGAVAVPAILPTLQASSPELRRLAADTLADMGRAAAAAAPNLIQTLKDPDASVRAAAATALGKMGSLAVSAVPALKEAAKDENPTVAQCASEALTNVAANHANVVEKKSDLLAGALKIPMTDTPVEEPKPHSAGHRKSPSAHAAKSKPTPSTPRALPATTDRINTWVSLLTSSTTPAALEAKSYLIQAGPKAVPALVKALRNSDKVDRWMILTTLGEVGSPATPAWLAVLEFVSDFSVDLRRAAAQALVKIDPVNAQQALSGFLQGTDPTPKVASAEALGTLGPMGAPVVPVLIDQLKSNDPELRESAANSLAQIGTPDALKAVTLYRQQETTLQATRLKDDLGKNLSQVNYKAVTALAKMGKDAIPVLKTAMLDRAAVVRQGAALALKQMGPVAAPTTDALIALLDDPEIDVRHAAADALQAIGTAQSTAPLSSFRLKSKFADPWDSMMRKFGLK